jgi:hypothetical protein
MKKLLYILLFITASASAQVVDSTTTSALPTGATTFSPTWAKQTVGGKSYLYHFNGTKWFRDPNAPELVQKLANKLDSATNKPLINQISSKQNQLNGTGFVKANGTTISYTTAIPNSDLALMPANTFKINNTSNSSTPIDATVSQVKSLLAYSTSDIPEGTNKYYTDARAAAAAPVQAITGTPNQISVTNTSGTYNLKLPQNIATGSNPVFAGISINNTPGVNASVGATSFGLSSGYAMLGYNFIPSSSGFNYKVDDYSWIADFGSGDAFRIRRANPGTAGGAISYSDNLTVLNDGNTGIVKSITSSGGQARFGGWYTGSELYKGPAAEIGYTNGQAAIAGYDRLVGAYVPLALTGTNLQYTAQNASGTHDFYIGNNKVATIGNSQMPYLGLTPPAWGSTAYMQAGVNATGSSAGDFLNFIIPSGKGFAFTSGGVNRMFMGGDGNIVASRDITANSFTKSGGTSSQFLKADGSVDANTYLTTSSASGFVSKTIADTTTAVKTFKRGQGSTTINGGTIQATGSFAGAAYAQISPGGLGVFDPTAGWQLTQGNNGWYYSSQAISGATFYTSLNFAPTTVAANITIPNKTGTLLLDNQPVVNNSLTVTSNNAGIGSTLNLNNNATNNGSSTAITMGYPGNYGIRLLQNGYPGNMTSGNFYIQNSIGGTWTNMVGFDNSLSATFYGNVTAPLFIKSGGTSSQFLKADGSVDANTYLTTSSASGFVPTTRTLTVNGSTFDLSANRTFPTPSLDQVVTINGVTAQSVRVGQIQTYGTNSEVDIFDQTLTSNLWKHNANNGTYHFATSTGGDVYSVNYNSNVLTFNNSPIVPAATLNAQAVNFGQLQNYQPLRHFYVGSKSTSFVGGYSPDEYNISFVGTDFNESTDYIITAGTDTYTLPTPSSGNLGDKYKITIKNRQSSNTIVINGSMFTNSAVTTLSLSGGSSIVLISDGTYWNVE